MMKKIIIYTLALALSIGFFIAHSDTSQATTFTSSGSVYAINSVSPPGKIAYAAASPEGQDDIFVMNADGSDMKRLTTVPYANFHPVFSPDGTKIAYSCANGEIMVMNSDGSNKTNISNNPSYDNCPAWSPGGSKIAFISVRDGNTEIYTMNTDGSNPVRLTFENSLKDELSWSPDGTEIAFVSDRDHLPFDPWSPKNPMDIYVMKSDGTNFVRLTNNDDFDYEPRWSPDGTKIAFSASRGTSNGGIYLMNADGSNQTRLIEGRFAAWSPDGTQIAFYDNYNIRAINTNGTNLTQITYKTSNYHDLAWSTNGGLATLHVSITLEGGSRPDSGYAVPLTIKLFLSGDTTSIDVLTDTPIYTFDLAAEKVGNNAIAQAGGISPGTYDISVVSAGCLTNVKRGVVIAASFSDINMGTLLEGNANDDNKINIQDFGILAASYGKGAGDSGYDARADFDRSGRINIADFGLLAANYVKHSPIEVP
jgi:Tol biopolymer transport system component